MINRIRDTFVAPGRLFAAEGPGTPWMGALGVATALAAIAAASEPAQFYLDQMENPVTRRGIPVDLTSPPETIVLWGRQMAAFSALVGHPLLGFAAAGLLFLLFRVILRGGANYRDYLAVASHGLIIGAVGMLAAIPLRMVTGNPEALPALWNFNLFTLWMLAFFARGAAALEARVTPLRATALLWSVYAVMVVAMSAITS